MVFDCLYHCALIGSALHCVFESQLSDAAYVNITEECMYKLAAVEIHNVTASLVSIID